MMILFIDKHFTAVDMLTIYDTVDLLTVYECSVDLLTVDNRRFVNR